MREEEFEVMVKLFHEELIEPGLTFISQQENIDSGRMDLLFNDAHENILIIEMKRDKLEKENTSQALRYKNELEFKYPNKKVRAMLVGTRVTDRIKSSMETQGVECKIIPFKKYSEVAKKYDIPFKKGIIPSQENIEFHAGFVQRKENESLIHPELPEPFGDHDSIHINTAYRILKECFSDKGRDDLVAKLDSNGHAGRSYLYIYNYKHHPHSKTYCNPIYWVLTQSPKEYLSKKAKLETISKFTFRINLENLHGRWAFSSLNDDEITKLAFRMNYRASALKELLNKEGIYIKYNVRDINTDEIREMNLDVEPEVYLTLPNEKDSVRDFILNVRKYINVVKPRWLDFIIWLNDKSIFNDEERLSNLYISFIDETQSTYEIYENAYISSFYQR